MGLSQSIKIYKEIGDNAIYVQVFNHEYYAELVTNINNNVVHVEKKPTTRSSVDWQTYKSESLGYIWVPLYQIPTFGGLKTTVSFSRSLGWTVSGGGLLKASYSNLAYEEDFDYIIVPNSVNKANHIVMAKVNKYKFYQENGAGQKRTVNSISNHIYELKSVYDRIDNLDGPSSVIKTNSPGNTTYKTSFGRTGSFEFSLSGSLATTYGNYNIGIKHSNSESVKRTYQSTNASRGYRIGYDAVSAY